MIFIYHTGKLHFDLEEIVSIQRNSNNGGFTNIVGAIDEAVATFKNSRRGNNIPKMLIVLTDGISNVGTFASLNSSAERARYSIFVAFLPELFFAHTLHYCYV